MRTGERLDLLAAAEFLERFVCAALDVVIAQFLAFVVGVLALGYAEFDFGSAVLEIDAQGHKRVTTFLKLGSQSSDFSSMQQQLPITKRLDVVRRTLLKRGDVYTFQRDRALSHHGIALLERATSIAEGLDLRTGK